MQKLWVIKPHLWPWIEFFSSGGQESWRLSWFSNNLSSWWLVWDSSGQGKNAWSSSSLFSQQVHFLLYFTNSILCLCEWMTRPAWRKWGALLCGSVVTSHGLQKKSVGGLYWLANTKRHQYLLWGPTSNGQSVWTKISFLSQNFWSLWPFHNFLGVRTTNLSVGS